MNRTLQPVGQEASTLWQRTDAARQKGHSVEGTEVQVPGVAEAQSVELNAEMDPREHWEWPWHRCPALRLSQGLRWAL